MNSNEIIKIDVPEYLHDTIMLFIKELQESPEKTIDVGFITRLAVVIDGKSRADERNKMLSLIDNEIRECNRDIADTLEASEGATDLTEQYNPIIKELLELRDKIMLKK